MRDMVHLLTPSFASQLLLKITPRHRIKKTHPRPRERDFEDRVWRVMNVLRNEFSSVSFFSIFRSHRLCRRFPDWDDGELSRWFDDRVQAFRSGLRATCSDSGFLSRSARWSSLVMRSERALRVPLTHHRYPLRGRLLDHFLYRYPMLV